MDIQTKKGIQLSQAFAAVLAVVLIAVLVIIAIFLFDALGTSFAGTRTVSVSNESGWINGSVYTVSNNTACQFGGFSVTAISNVTGESIPVTNVTTTTTGGIFNSTVEKFDNVGFDYSYTWGGEACDATDNLTAQFATYPALVGLVGTIVFLGLVIGVLVASFVFGSRKRV